MTSDEARIRSALDEFRHRHRVPGVAVCTFTSAGPRCAVGSGVASLESPDQVVTPDTVFRIYSVTKLLTGTLVVALASNGLLKLDAPVNQSLPELRVRGAADDGGVTLRHLLSHQAGWLPDSVRHDGFDRNADSLERTVLRSAARMPMLASPGTVYSYSNLGASLAGVVAQRVVGEPFGELIAERLYAPLGMTRTTHDPAVAMTFPLAQHHVLDARGDLRVAHGARQAVAHEPASQCYSTATDMARFGALHLGGARAVMPASWTGRMHRVHSDPRLDVDLRYGLTCYLGPPVAGVRQVGHEGFLDGMWVKLVLDPARDFGVVWLDNRGEELREHRYRVLAELFGGLGHTPADVDRPHGSITADRVAGTYYRVGAEPLAVTAEGEDVVVSASCRRLPLVPGPAGTWVSRTEHGPGSPPWGPHAGSRRVCLGATAGPDGDIAFVHLNGLPYARQGGARS
jgi:CubicO group peptidase (beta-lactamase class C family)